MLKCKKCGCQLEKDFTFCRFCGEPVCYNCMVRFGKKMELTYDSTHIPFLYQSFKSISYTIPICGACLNLRELLEEKIYEKISTDHPIRGLLAYRNINRKEPDYNQVAQIAKNWARIDNDANLLKYHEELMKYANYSLQCPNCGNDITEDYCNSLKEFDENQSLDEKIFFFMSEEGKTVDYVKCSQCNYLGPAVRAIGLGKYLNKYGPSKLKNTIWSQLSKEMIQGYREDEGFTIKPNHARIIFLDGGENNIWDLNLISVEKSVDIKIIDWITFSEKYKNGIKDNIYSVWEKKGIKKINFKWQHPDNSTWVVIIENPNDVESNVIFTKIINIDDGNIPQSPPVNGPINENKVNNSNIDIDNKDSSVSCVKEIPSDINKKVLKFPCLKCKGDLNKIEKYNQWYCARCKEYLNEDYVCSKCNCPLKYVTKYKQWYCDTCEEYADCGDNL